MRIYYLSSYVNSDRTSWNISLMGNQWNMNKKYKYKQCKKVMPRIKSFITYPFSNFHFLEGAVFTHNEYVCHLLSVLIQRKNQNRNTLIQKPRYKQAYLFDKTIGNACKLKFQFVNCFPDVIAMTYKEK